VRAVSPNGRTRLVTGASSGIGAATVRSLAAAGFEVVAAARRLERCEEVAREVGGAPAPRRDRSRLGRRVAEALPDVSVLINNAGARSASSRSPRRRGELARHVRDQRDGRDEVTKALLPALERSGDGHIVIVGSVAGMEVYPGGGGYTAAKHGAHALTQTLRLELLGKPIRVTEIAPGLVETEFSVVRFGGDREQADAVYEGVTPLTGEDVADAIAWVVTRPPYVDVDYVSIKPTDQATARDVHRR
jgi:NADP-dependent 3-hydroxy acid dehydrogenase YdfG